MIDASRNAGDAFPEKRNQQVRHPVEVKPKAEGLITYALFCREEPSVCSDNWGGDDCKDCPI
jgi:hypothetical protein